MSKMSAEFEKNLDNAKYDLYEACKGILSALEYTGWINSIDVTVVAQVEELKKAIAKVETLDNKK